MPPIPRFVSWAYSTWRPVGSGRFERHEDSTLTGYQLAMRRATLAAMAIISVVRCRRMAVSLPFYTQVLDFAVADGVTDAEALLRDPSFVVLRRDGDSLCLSSHGGDGEFGQVVVVTTDDLDALFRKYQSRGFSVPVRPESPVHSGPTDQTWGTRELYVDDPDGNTLRFTQPSTERSSG